MRRTAIISVTTALLVATATLPSSLTAQDVVRMTGRIEVLRDGSWEELRDHAEIPEQAEAVRVAPRSEVLLQDRERLLWLNRRGSYRVDELLALHRELYRAEVPDLLEEILFEIVEELCSQARIVYELGYGEDEPRHRSEDDAPPARDELTPAGGGACVGLGDRLEHDGVQALLRAVVASEEGRVIAARRYAQDAVEMLDAEHELMIPTRLTAAYISRLAFDLPGAVGHLNSVQAAGVVEPGGSFDATIGARLVAAYLLFDAALLLEQAAYADAVATLSGFLHQGGAETGYEDAAYVLLGAAYRGLGNLGAARRAFQQAAEGSHEFSSRVARRLAAESR